MRAHHIMRWQESHLKAINDHIYIQTFYFRTIMSHFRTSVLRIHLVSQLLSCKYSRAISHETIRVLATSVCIFYLGLHTEGNPAIASRARSRRGGAIEDPQDPHPPRTRHCSQYHPEQNRRQRTHRNIPKTNLPSPRRRSRTTIPHSHTIRALLYASTVVPSTH